MWQGHQRGGGACSYQVQKSSQSENSDNKRQQEIQHHVQERQNEDSQLEEGCWWDELDQRGDGCEKMEEVVRQAEESTVWQQPIIANVNLDKHALR